MKYLSKVTKQHNSVLTVIPKGIATGLGIKAGDVVMFEVEKTGANAKFTRHLKGRGHNDTKQRNRNNKD